MPEAAAGLRPEISVVIPCFNEQENVREIHAAVTEQIAQHVRSYEILFIDNGSTDDTRSLMREICARDPLTRAIFNNRNYGQMRSPTYAIYQAEGDGVIAMGADFQDPPALIGALVAQWRAGAQVVLAQRRTERATAGTRLSRWLGYTILGQFADYPVVPGATGFGLFDRACVDALAAWNEPEPFFRDMVVESGFRIAVIPYDRPERAAGSSKNNFRTLLDFAISGLAGSSKAMLRAPIMLSVFAAIGAFILLLLALVAGIGFGGAAWHLPFLLGVQTGMFAVLLLFIGLIGEQLRVVSERTRNVPLVIEEERINFPTDRQRPAARTLVQAVRTEKP